MTEREWLTMDGNAAGMWAHLKAAAVVADGKCVDIVREMNRLHKAACIEVLGWDGPLPTNGIDKWVCNRDRGLPVRPDEYGIVESVESWWRVAKQGNFPVGDYLSRWACPVLRAIFGNPFRPVEAAGKPWLTPTVVEGARDIHDREAWELMPVLADALEDAGCDAEPLLMHLRGMRFGPPPCKRCKGKRTVPTGPGGAVPDRPARKPCPKCKDAELVWEADPSPVRCRGDWALDMILGRT